VAFENIKFHEKFNNQKDYFNSIKAEYYENNSQKTQKILINSCNSLNFDNKNKIKKTITSNYNKTNSFQNSLVDCSDRGYKDNMIHEDKSYENNIEVNNNPIYHNNNNIDFNLKTTGKWSEDEDKVLTELVSKYGGKNWKKISSFISGRSSIQCLHRWTKILQPGLVKGPWTIEEDRKLLEWIRKEGPTKWTLCADFIKGRNGKQCRERWFHTLNPKIIKGNWTCEEDFKIFTLYDLLGGKWAKIAVHVIGRSENSIKNRFYSTLRRKAAEKTKNEISDKSRKCCN